MMPRLGEQYQIKTEGITHQGDGVCRIDHMAVFVPGLLLGEEAKIKITSIQGKLAYGELVERTTDSPHRIVPKCPQSEHCGGCAFLHSDYDYQLQAKTQIVQDAMNRIGHSNISPQPTIGMDEPYGYRNKGVFHVNYERGTVRLGFYGQGSHQFVPVRDCLLFDRAVNQLVLEIEAGILQEGRANYIQKVMIRQSKDNGEMMVVFVTEDNTWRLPNLTERIIAYPQVVSVYHNINKNPKMMLGKGFHLLAGKATLQDRIGFLQFDISPQSFFQINNIQAKRLYDLAAEFADLKGEENVVDAYCGIGTIGMYIAQNAKTVYGVESIHQAIQDAKENAKKNQIENCIFTAAKAEEWLPKWVKNHTADVIIVDPPRVGCHKFLLDALEDSQAKKIVYISCNPSTLARDVAYLQKGSYRLEKVQPVDVFPQTYHVETVVLLSKGEIDSKRIRVEFPLDDMEITAF